MSLELTEQFLRCKLVAVIRADHHAPLLPLCEALVASGFRAIELTTTIPNAAVALATLRRQLPGGLLWGMGSVTDPKQAQAALDAGADFLVSPVLWLPLIKLAHRENKLAIPAGATPTEIHAAWQAGANFVKVFPVHLLGGPEYIRALRAPMPQLPLIPSGGVGAGNIAEYFRAGASVVNVGATLIRKDLISAGRFGEITALARQFVSAVSQA